MNRVPWQTDSEIEITVQAVHQVCSLDPYMAGGGGGLERKNNGPERASGVVTHIQQGLR